MAPRSSRDVPSNQIGKFNSQRFDGSVVIDVPSGHSFVMTAAKVASTGIRRLLAEGLKRNELVFWTTRESFEGSEMDQIYCDRIENQQQRLSSSTSSNPAGLGGSASPRLIPYDEPHPYSLSGSRDIGTVRQRTMYGDPSYSISYEERARRSSRAYEENSLRESPTPSHNTQRSYNHTLPPYASGESLPLYTRNGRSEEEIEEGIPSRSRGDFDNHYGGRQHSSSGRDR